MDNDFTIPLQIRKRTKYKVIKINSMDKVRAKFRCESVRQFAYGHKEVEFTAVCSDKGENKDFAEATPFGEIKIQIDKDVPAKDFFEPGKEYLLCFKPANEEKEELQHHQV